MTWRSRILGSWSQRGRAAPNRLRMLRFVSAVSSGACGADAHPNPSGVRPKVGRPPFGLGPMLQSMLDRRSKHLPHIWHPAAPTLRGDNKATLRVRNKRECRCGDARDICPKAWTRQPSSSVPLTGKPPARRRSTACRKAAALFGRCSLQLPRRCLANTLRWACGAALETYSLMRDPVVVSEGAWPAVVSKPSA